MSDILMAIDLIESFTKDTASFDDFSEDIKTQSAIERQLGIIGEAVNKFKKEFPDQPLENTKQIVAFRNRIIHAYDSIDHSIVWAIIKRHISPLKDEVFSKFSG